MVSIKVMEDYSSSSFLQYFIHLSCGVGYPKKVLPDKGSQLITGCGAIKIEFWDGRFQLQQQINIDYDQCLTAAHHMHGKVEQKIQQIKESIQKTIMTNTSVGDSTCWNLEFYQQSIFSHWKHNWWPWKSWPDNTELNTVWTEQWPESNGTINC